MRSTFFEFACIWRCAREKERVVALSVPRLHLQNLVCERVWRGMGVGAGAGVGVGVVVCLWV